MPGDAHVAVVAAVLADPTRAAILMALMDGRAWAAGELARTARVSPSTASNHLTQLVERSFLTVERQGRHRYYSLTDPEIAHMVETLAALAPAAPVRLLSESEAAKAMRAARMCYRHLAGRLGVALSQALVERGALATVDGGYLVTVEGECRLEEVGIEIAALKTRGQTFAPYHIDWSERRHHVGGALGAALAQRIFDLGWMKRVPRSRAVRLTEAGREALCTYFGLRLDPSSPVGRGERPDL
jgi:DNA-binding transcriptional ArsR family regulator